MSSDYAEEAFHLNSKIKENYLPADEDPQA
jgi:hypothetical protein